MPSAKLKAESGSYQITGFPPGVRIHSRLPDDDPLYAKIGLLHPNGLMSSTFLISPSGNWLGSIRSTVPA
jgi:hypothetical protein